MADSSDLPLRVRAFLKLYHWHRIDPVPWSPMKKPLTRANVALVSSAGMIERNQAPFDDEKRGGDTTYREIPDSVQVSTLIDTHRSETFDHRGIQSDPNLAFPLDRLHELRDSGIIGAVNHRHFSFMGSITAPGRLIAESAPDAARKLASDGVDAVLLVPV